MIHLLLHLSSSLFKVFSSTLSSFISNFAIGIGDSDSGSLIQQPLVDQKVISINGSSKEEARHGASDSESPSLEWLTVSCRASGTSHPRGKAQPSATSPIEELVPITMILPSYIFGGARKSGGGGVRASPRVRCSHSARSSSSLLLLLVLNR